MPDTSPLEEIWSFLLHDSLQIVDVRHCSSGALKAYLYEYGLLQFSISSLEMLQILNFFSKVKLQAIIVMVFLRRLHLYLALDPLEIIIIVFRYQYCSSKKKL